MSDFPTSKLDKALARRAAVSTSRPAWQELLDRHDTVPASALQAPEVLKGFQGSWAAQYVIEGGQRTQRRGEAPAPVQRQVNHLGQPGVPEINFRPYDWGTTRHGKYGPSLLGHPVSFSVLGPTAKLGFTNHQWRLDPTGTNDVLTLDSCDWNGDPYGFTIPQVYGPTAATIPEGGLYLVITQTGHLGRLESPATNGGLGDGTYGTDAEPIPGRDPIRARPNGRGQRVKYEVFRVIDINDTSITLDSGKRIGDYFDYVSPPARTPIIRSIMLLQPAAARLVAVPGSGSRGREQVFAFVPPERALNSDLQPPYLAWQNGGVDPWWNFNNAGAAGDAEGYTPTALPVPRPIRKGSGVLTGVVPNFPVWGFFGSMLFHSDPDVMTWDATADVGRVLRFYDIIRVRDGNWTTATADAGGGWNIVGDPELDHLLGYWEVVFIAPGAGPGGTDTITVRMVPQVDPVTGVPFFGHPASLVMSPSSLAGQEVRLKFTLHDNIASLWTDTYLSPVKLDSARLTHIIDPRWAKPSVKNLDLEAVEAAQDFPDVAIFATGSQNGGADGSNENPGNLMDLGFRPVLFPAKVSDADPTKLVPDFDHPITSNEVVLDPTVDGKQFIEIDYAAGLVYLSHPPKVGPGCQLAPDTLILTNASNPRHEMVFFASFVPFSQEPGQRGAATRVTGGQPQDVDGSACLDSADATDVFGSRLYWPVEAGQTISSGTYAGNAGEVRLDVLLTPIDLPMAGFFDLVKGRGPTGEALWTWDTGRISTFGYSAVNYNDGGKTVLRGVYGGGRAGVDTFAVTDLAPATLVLRREVVAPNLADGSTGTNFEYDTTYGHNKRATALRFPRARVSAEGDGSVSVDTRDPLTENHQELFSDLFSSWVIRGGDMVSTLPNTRLEFTELTVLIEGVRTVLPAQTVILSALDKYVYIDGSAPACPVYATTGTLPLPNPQDVLIGRYAYILFVGINAYQDLRQPLVDIDKRLDITVGEPAGHDQPGDAHFATLAEAVQYVRETMQPFYGTAGRYRRIKIIGPTQEDTALLPIAPQLPGLIIEGAARRLDGSVGTPFEVTWDGDVPLFDLSGCHGIVIRNVNFRYVWSAPSATPRHHTLFTCDYRVDGVRLHDALIENVTLFGPAHGFFYGNDDVDVDTGCNRVTFRNCVAEELTDFAIWCSSGFYPADYLRVKECVFKVENVPANAELTWGDYGIIVSNGDSTNWVIEDCSLEGGYKGIRFLGKYTTIQRTIIRNTAKTAVDARGYYLTLKEVRAPFCHIDVASDQPGVGAGDRVVIGLRLGSPALVQDCLASLNGGPTATDYAFFAQDNGSDSKVDLTYNELFGRVAVGPHSSVQNNHIYNELVLGDNSVASGNLIEDDAGGAGDLEPGADCVVSDNVAEGSFGTMGWAARCRLSNNWFKGSTVTILQTGTICSGDIFEGEVTFWKNGKFTDCQFNGDFSTGANDGDTADNDFVNCTFSNVATGIRRFQDTKFSNCMFEVTGANALLTLSGIHNTLVGNIFKGDFTLSCIDIGDRASTRAIIKGNLLRKTGATYAGLFVGGHGCVVEGNICQGSVFAPWSAYGLLVLGPTGLNTASSVTVANNVVGAPGESLYLGVIGIKAAVTGNRVFGGFAGGLVDSTVQGNTLGEVGVTEALSILSLATTSAQVACSGNAVTGYVLCSATSSVFANNEVVADGTSILSGQYTSYEGNFFLGDGAHVRLSAPDCSFKDNVVGGLTGLAYGLAGGQQNIIGNKFLKDVDIVAADALWNSTITGNFFMSKTDFDNGGAQSLVDCTFTGNYVNSIFDSTNALRTSFTGNRFMTTCSLFSVVQCTIQGNWVGASGVPANLNLLGADDYICMGNFVTGEIRVDAGVGATTCGIVMGNRCAAIDDGAAGAVPTNYQVTMGNKVANGAGGTVYGVAPATATQNIHNIKDDA